MENRNPRKLPEEVSDGSDFYDFSDTEQGLYYNYPFNLTVDEGDGIKNPECSQTKKRRFQEAFQEVTTLKLN